MGLNCYLSVELSSLILLELNLVLSLSLNISLMLILILIGKLSLRLSLNLALALALPLALALAQDRFHRGLDVSLQSFRTGYRVLIPIQNVFDLVECLIEICLELFKGLKLVL